MQAIVDASNLVNSQKAEIEALNEVTDKLASENSKLQEELKKHSRSFKKKQYKILPIA